MLNIVIPMAGRGSRFAKVGYKLPKPLIEVHGRPMVRTVIDNLQPNQPHKFIFLCLREHLSSFGLAESLAAWAPGCKVIPIDTVTEGAACTVLLAAADIDNSDALMIANCDQWVDTSIDDYLAAMDKDRLDGLIMTMPADDPKWSFARVDDAGLVTDVREKEVISNEATVGIYNYRTGRAFVENARRMIAKDFRVNGEFYVAPVYNEMIAVGARIGCFNIGPHAMYGIGTPEDLDMFLSNPVSLKAIK